MRYCKLSQTEKQFCVALIDLWTCSTDVCPNVDVMEKAFPDCPGFSQHAKNTALIDPLSLSFIPSLLLHLSSSFLPCHLSVSRLSTVSSI